MQAATIEAKREPVTGRRVLVMIFTANGSKLYEVKDGNLIEMGGSDGL